MFTHEPLGPLADPEALSEDADISLDAAIVSLKSAKAEKDPDMYLPIYIISSVFLAIFIIVPCFVPKGPNKGIIKISIMIAAFSMWLFWVTVYIAQMNPLMGPRLHNETLAFIAHAWGKSVGETASTTTTVSTPSPTSSGD